MFDQNQLEIIAAETTSGDIIGYHVASHNQPEVWNWLKGLPIIKHQWQESLQMWTDRKLELNKGKK